MDPNANLAEIATLLDTKGALDRARRTELCRALHGWVSGGGLEPNWVAFPAASKFFKGWVRRRQWAADSNR
jgi:hypothetical protein